MTVRCRVLTVDGMLGRGAWGPSAVMIGSWGMQLGKFARHT